MYHEEDLRGGYEIRKSEKITNYFVGFGVYSLVNEELYNIQEQFRSISLEDVALIVSIIFYKYRSRQVGFESLEAT